jgi:glycosyltransferase involved in cell wall biosynthesis
MVWPVYVVFEHLVYRRFRKELRAGSFHIIHRVTPLSPTVPSPLAGLTDVPMVIGPLNGGLPWPTKEYPELLRREREWLTKFRWMYRLLPFRRSTFRHLSAVISGSRHTATEIPPWFRGLRFYLAENGVAPDRFPLASSWPEPRGRFRFISMGRLVPFKGFDLVLEAMAGSDLLRQNSELVIVGDGPMRGPLDELVARHQLDACVRLLGRLEHRTLAETTGQSQAFVFPSLREFGGAVVLEAMAKALPVIVVDYGGPGELATPGCGFMLQMARRDVLIPKLREAMERLVEDPDLCRAMGKAGRDRVQREFTWDAKAERLVEIYRTILESVTAPERSRSVGGPTSPTASAAC